jgi:hypothetical protein
MVETVTYDRSWTLAAARALYFEKNGFGADGGYRKRWVPVKVGPAEFVIPNTAGRVRSVPLHDLHHIVTGYPTSIEGEALIGAWELGSGCSDHFAAWYLNANVFAYGLVLAPRELWRAFVRGRRSKNLYGQEFDLGMLAGTVGELRDRLEVDSPHEAHAGDGVLFAVWLCAGVYVLAWNVACAPALLAATILTRLARRVARQRQ